MYNVIEVLVATVHFFLISMQNRFWIKCLLNQQKSSGLLLLDIPRKTGAMNSFHVRTYQFPYLSAFTGNTFPGSSLAFIPHTNLHVSPYSLYLHLLPNTADKWRVILKAERLDYINASFVNVGIKLVYFKIYPYNNIMLSLCRATSSTKGSSLHRPL